MAATKAMIGRAVPGASTGQGMNFTGDTSYPTGGYVLLASDFGLNVLRKISAAFFTTVAGASSYEVAIVPTYNSDGVTLAQVNVALATGGAQVANGTNVSAVGLFIEASGN